jgi:hypothetical protein
MSSEKMIKDPGGNLDELQALAHKMVNRYDSPPIYLTDDDYASRYSDLCDAVIQVLWADSYGTSPEDPLFHTSSPARAIAGILMTAAGLDCECNSG